MGFLAGLDLGSVQVKLVILEPGIPVCNPCGSVASRSS